MEVELKAVFKRHRYSWKKVAREPLPNALEPADYLAGRFNGRSYL
jgi:hypothetical protein